jgi:hypothetical protein
MTASATVALYHPIGISAFRRSRCQRARVLRIPDFPIRDARVSSIGYREIVTSNATIPMYAKTSKCRIPTPSDPLTRVPPIERLRPCREIADRDFIVQEFHDSGNSDMPNPDSSGSSDTRPQRERLGSRREIADRDFLLHNFFTLENSDAPKHRLVRISCHASSPMDGS